MFERFTDRARRVVVLAQEEARIAQLNYIGTEHILIALAHEGEGIAARALHSVGVRLDTARSAVAEVCGPSDMQAPPGHIPFTPQAKKILELALREALQLGHNYIGTEHILLGLIRDGDGVGAQVLFAMHVDLDELRRKVIEMVTLPKPEWKADSASVTVFGVAQGGGGAGGGSGSVEPELSPGSTEQHRFALRLPNGVMKSAGSSFAAAVKARQALAGLAVRELGIDGFSVPIMRQTVTTNVSEWESTEDPA